MSIKTILLAILLLIASSLQAQTINTTVHPIIDNGGITFLVKVTGSNVSVFSLNKEIEYDYYNYERSYDILVKEYQNVSNVLYGSDSDYNGPRNSGVGKIGNALIVEIEPLKYAYIGDSSFYEFETQDKIISLHLLVGNSEVVYPVAVGELFVYFPGYGARDGFYPLPFFFDFPEKFSWKVAYNRMWNDEGFGIGSLHPYKTQFRITSVIAQDP